MPRSQIGPRALACIGTLGTLGTRYHLTQGKVRDLLAQMLGVDFSIGAISQAHGKVAAALGAPVREARASLRESGPKWGLRCHAYLMRIFRGTVNWLWWSQRKGKCSGPQITIDSVNTYLRQQMRAFIGPPQLALLGHAPDDHFVHRRLGNSTADWQSLVVPASVVHQIPVVRSEAPPSTS